MAIVPKRSIKDMTSPDLNQQPLCIEYPGLEVDFELKSGLIHLLPTFRGLAEKHHVKACDICTSPEHVTDMCPTLQEPPTEHAEAIGGFSGQQRRYDPFSNTYNPGWRDHPNLSYANSAEHSTATTKHSAIPAKCSDKHSAIGVSNESTGVIRWSARISSGKELQDHKDENDTKRGHAQKRKPKKEVEIPQDDEPKEDQPKVLVTRPPFPKRFTKSKKEEEEKEIFETFRKVEVNIPLLDAIKQILRYAKFLKELCTNKGKLKENERRAMCDLGASINVMPLTIFESLHVGPLKETGVVIQLADRSVVYPEGVLEDVLVQVNELIFPANFYVLDMREDNSPNSTSILLGRSFLKTARTRIDVHSGTLTMEFDGEIIRFNIYDSMRYPTDIPTALLVDVLDPLVQSFATTNNKDHVKFAIEESLTPEQVKALEESMVMDIGIIESIFELGALSPLPLNLAFIEMPQSRTKLLPSILQTPVLELKELPNHLKYAFLRENNTLPIIVSSKLTPLEEEKLVRVLREFREAIGWTIADIKGLSPSTYMHRILLEEGTKPSREAQLGSIRQ
ncbi:UNVERIFIED_CONTAM: hypothetical protein Slati_1751800 [Sesamum latifolium]|uniref:Retrotransposon gag protein n=1 Tax=Sesamum latifolium TaxID=2727402 RepID=A0AAW2WW19_9LAMI